MEDCFNGGWKVEDGGGRLERMEEMDYSWLSRQYMTDDEIHC